MTFIKTKQFNWSLYFLQTFFCIYFLLSPLLLSYFFDVNNPNNTAYNIGIISKHFFKISAVIILFSYVLNLPFLFIKRSFQKVFFVIFFATFYVTSVLDFLHVVLFKSRANSSSFFSVFSSNQNESLEFILDYSTSHVIFSLLLLLLIPFGIYLIHKKVLHHIFKKIAAILFALLFLASSYITFTKSEAKFYKEISIYKLVEEYTNYKNEILLLSNNKNSANLNIQKTRIQEPETYIFIIGESTSKYHMQLYGYQRKTTPELMRLKNELIVFNNVKSDHVHTVESIKDMLVLGNPENNTLIDCFNEAGFSTYWLSNQTYLGENETPVSAIAKKTTQQFYINTSGSNKLDGKLLPELDVLLDKKENKKVVFIHIMGTHLNYQDRYPNTFNLFTDNNISVFGEHADSHVNQYDNAVLYNDFVVSEIIKKAKKLTGLTSVVYLSDHGDEVYDFRNFHGHSGAMLSKYMSNVPFFIWNNKTFNTLKKEKIILAKENVNLNFSLKNFSHSVQDLFDVKSKYYNSSSSFFSKKDSISIVLNIQDSTAQIAAPKPINFETKIWVHRINSLERLSKIQGLFKGMELDIVYENGKFDVRHPPASSINLSLEEFLTHVNSPHEHYFWLDLKNITLQNAEEITQRLNFLTKKFNIKKNIIVETTNPETIPQLNTNGYFSSYYLPNLSNLDEGNLYKELSSINKNIALNNPTAISQNIGNYYIMAEHFKYQNKFIWALNLDWNNPKTHRRIETLLNKDHTIKVCLVNYSTAGWR